MGSLQWRLAGRGMAAHHMAEEERRGGTGADPDPASGRLVDGIIMAVMWDGRSQVKPRQDRTTQIIASAAMHAMWFGWR